MLETMYPAAANSRQTELAAAINDTQTSFTVLDGSVLPPAPNLLTLGTDESAETILYTTKTGNEITGVTRGFEGLAKTWVAGTKLARYFTAYDHDTFRDNISDLDQRLNNIPAPEDASLTQKGIVQLSSATESEEEGEAATPKAVNTVRQLAVSQIGDLSELQTTDKDNLVDALNEVFTHVDEGKELVKTAVIVKGGTVAGTSPHSFEELADGIETIETSTVINGQQQVARTYAETIAANDPVYAYTTFLNDNYIVNPPPSSIVNAVDFNSDGTYLAIGINTSPFLLIFKKSGKVFTRLSNPAALPTSTVYGLSWSPDDVYLAVAHAGSPNLTLYKRSGDTLSKLSNPSTLPPDSGLSAAWSPDGIYLAVGHIAAPCLTFYKRTGDVLVKQADPAILPSSTVNSVDWSPDGVHLAIGSNSASPYAAIYKRTGDTIARLSTPNFLPTSTVYCVAFSPDGVFLAISTINTPYVYFYKRSGDTFTRTDGPPVYTSGPALSMSWDDNNEYLYIAHNISPFFSKYRRWGDKFRKMPDLNLLPTSGRSVAFNNGMLAVGSNALEIYSINYDQVFKSTNEALTLDGGYMTAIGYALESGQAGDTKNIMSIWR
ncbi:tail fiber protein [Paenibacillus xylanexedens]|uniref:tail fiber protein n=1 Tax=Paenibacillus xylanexedens TaxID=528191 RepID=UPI0011A63383|nr:tail fiber protein [Paenibacillus xylanexedens]